MNRYAKEQKNIPNLQKDIKMSKEQIKVVLIETFKGEKYILRLDREYENALMRLFRNLFKKAPLGSLAHISLRNIEEEGYDNIPASAAFMEPKGIKDDKEKGKEDKKLKG